MQTNNSENEIKPIDQMRSPLRVLNHRELIQRKVEIGKKYNIRIKTCLENKILENYGGLDILWWDTPTDMTKERAEKFLPIIENYKIH